MTTIKKDIKYIILVNSAGHKFSHPREESPQMHRLLKELIAKYKLMFKDTFHIKRCEFTKEGLKIK